jgi:hypothetical protein
MILVRDVFRLKFGKAREALAAWKEFGEFAKRTGFSASSYRVSTDLVGPYYTLVFESTYADLAAFEAEIKRSMGNPEWRAVYQNFSPHVESGYREIFTVQEQS